MTGPHDDTIALLRDAATRHTGSGQVNLAEVLRAGAARRHRQAARRAAGVTALSTASVVAAIVVGTAALGGSNNVTPAREDQPDDAATDALALLGRPGTEEDPIPTINSGDEDDTSPYGVVPDSSRLVTAVDGVGHYAAFNDDGDICIAVHLQAQSHVATGCANPQRFNAVGVWVQASNYSGADVTGLLLPDNLNDPDPGQIPQLLERAGLQPSDDYALLAPNLVATMRND